MAIAQRYVAQQQTGRGGPSGLADVLEVLLDKGLVIDAFVRVSLVGIELLTVDARVVVASVDTYLRFAEAVNRLDLVQASNAQTLGDLVGGSSGGRGRREQRDEDGGGRNGSGRHELGAGRSEAGSGPRGEDGGGDREEEPARADAGGGGAERGRADDSGGGDREQSGEESSEGGLLSRIKQRGQAF
jgi:hypothetical protein